MAFQPVTETGATALLEETRPATPPLDKVPESEAPADDVGQTDARHREQAASDELAWTLEKKIQQKTWGRIHSLRVDASDDQVNIRARTSSYYLKQLAIQAILETVSGAVTEPVRLAVDIEVGTGTA